MAKKKSKPRGRSLESQRNEADRKARYAASKRSEHSNIGTIPSIKPEYQELRDECERDLELWHQEVFKSSTGLKRFGRAQQLSIGCSQLTITEGGRTQKIEPRGFGKSTRTINEAIWAILYNYRRFVCVCGSSKDFATELFESIKLELETNPILLEMFPHVCYPIWCLEGKSIKAKTQHINGVPTKMEWGSDKLVLATVDGFDTSGSVFQVKSIRSVRGAFHRTVLFGVIRPDLYLLDDIQTDDIAASDTRVKKFINSYIKKGILRGGGWSRNTAVVNVATIIQPDDVPDTLSRDPAWVTSKFKLLEEPSDNEDFWFGPYQKAKQNYRIIEHDAEQTKRNKRKADEAATALYLKHRKKADKGARVSWDWAWPWESYDEDIAAGRKPTCVSSIQKAYDIRIEDGEEAFASECQSEPIRINVHSGETNKPTRKQLIKAITTIKRGEVPLDMTRLVTYIDLHKRLFYWVTVAKNTQNNNRHVVDYNTWPEQSARTFTLENAKKNIPQIYPGMGTKAMAQKAVARFLTIMAAKRWKNQNGQRVFLDEIRIDANWGGTTKNVRKAILNHPAFEKTWGCHGIGRTEKQTGLDEWELKTGEERWPGAIRSKYTDHGVKTMNIDTNQWKTETCIAINTPQEESGTLTFFDGDEMVHELFFDHLLVENCEAKTGRRDIEVFTNPKNGQNHWWDCLVGAMVDDDKAERKESKGNTYRL